MRLPPKIVRSVLIRALRWRTGATAALLLTATIAIAVAAIGPAYLATADTTVLRSELDRAGPVATSVSVIARQATASAGATVIPVQNAASRDALNRWFRPGIVTLDSGIDLKSVGYSGDLVSRSDVCGHLTFIAGHCPVQIFTIAITQRDATALHVSLGQAIKVPKVGDLTVVGIVKVGNAQNPYWLGDNFFGFYSATFTPNRKIPAQLDAFFASSQTLDATKATASDQFPLRVNRVIAADLPALQQSLARFKFDVMYQNSVLSVASHLPGSFNTYMRQASAMTAIVAVVALQLVLLTLFVLYVLVARTANASQLEVAFAKLRDARLFPLVMVGLGEPLAVLTVALPLGLIVALFATELASRAMLENAPLTFPPLAPLAALAAYGGGLAATLAGGRRILTRRLLDELRAVETLPSPSARAAWDGAGLALAIAGMVELVTLGVLNSGRPNPLAILAPGLVALGMGIVGVRLIPILYRALLQTPLSQRVGIALAIRQVVRRPTGMTQVLVVAIAVGLACFSVIGWYVAGSNRIARAEFTVGASRRLEVTFPPSINFVQAVRRADPTGRYAMAVEVSETQSGPLLAVDVSRLKAVAFWPRSISKESVSQIARWLNPRVPPPLVLTGSAIRVRIDLSGNPNPKPDLQLNLIDSSGNLSVADFGYLSDGGRVYTANLPPSCAAGCRVTSLSPIWDPGPTDPQQTKYQLALAQPQQRAGTAPWRSIANKFMQPAYWTPSSSAVAVGASDGLLRVSVQVNAVEFPPAISPGVLPATLPGVITAASQSGTPRSTSVEDFDGTPLTLNTRIEVTALPQLGAYGTIIDLPLAIRAETSSVADTSYYVWLASDAPSRIVTDLRRQGLVVESDQTPARLVSIYNTGGLALAYQFFLFAAVAAALMAAGTAALSLFMASRRRAYELSILQAVGVPESALLTSLLGEQLLVLVPGLVIGIGAGLVASAFALPAVPEFTSTNGGPPLQLAVPALPVVALTLILLALLMVTATLAARGVLRGTGVAHLRMETV